MVVKCRMATNLSFGQPVMRDKRSNHMYRLARGVGLPPSPSYSGMRKCEIVCPIIRTSIGGNRDLRNGGLIQQDKATAVQAQRQQHENEAGFGLSW